MSTTPHTHHARVEDANASSLIERLMGFDGPPEQFLQQLIATQCAVGGAAAGAMLKLDAENQPGVLAAYPPLSRDAPAPVWLAMCAQAAGKQVEAGALGAAVLSVPGESTDAMYANQAKAHAALLPMTERSPEGDGQVRIRGFGAFVMPGTTPERVRNSLRALELTLPLLGLYEMRLSQAQQQGTLDAYQNVLQTQAAVAEHERFRPAAMAFVHELAKRWQARRVILGMVKGRDVHVQVISHAEQFSRKTQAVQEAEAAMAECLDQGVEVIVPAPPDGDYAYRISEQYRRQQAAGQVCLVPMFVHGKVRGVALLEFEQDQELDCGHVQAVRLTTEVCGQGLAERFDRERFFAIKAVRATRRLAAIAVGPRYTWAKLAAAACLAVVLFLMLAKGQYRVSAPMVIETVQRQIITAPFEGTLDEVPVEPGDVISAHDTLLARLDTSELELERARLEQQRFEHLREADLALRDEGSVEVQIARAKARQVDAQLKLIDRQISLASVTSAMTGRVVEGDVKRLVGGRVDKGQSLFEIAPIDAMRGVLRVEDSDIADVKVGQIGELAPATNPDMKIQFEVERISPVAKTEGQSNYFEVRVKLSQIPDWLRVGMEGRGRIDVDRRLLAWIWTRDAMNWVRMTLWL